MTTEVPIYLVSACSTVEEFVAAFRRYVDRSGVFVPIAEPFQVGRRARVALTLAGGGVMIEGTAEVVGSSTKPSALHGRIGMTLRFVDADEPSKAVLSEIEKARLVMKAPTSSSLTARPGPSPLPDGPTPTPPPSGGRIDAANALAECTARGDTKPEPVAPMTPGGSTSGPIPVAVPEATGDSGPNKSGSAKLQKPAPLSQPIPMMGRRDPRLPLQPRTGAPSTGQSGPIPTVRQPTGPTPVVRPPTPSTVPPSISGTGAMPALPRPAPGSIPPPPRNRIPTGQSPAVSRTPTPGSIVPPTLPVVGRTPNRADVATIRDTKPPMDPADVATIRDTKPPADRPDMATVLDKNPTGAMAGLDPKLVRGDATASDPDVAIARSTTDPQIGRTASGDLAIGRVNTPTVTGPPPSPDDSGRFLAAGAADATVEPLASGEDSGRFLLPDAPSTIRVPIISDEDAALMPDAAAEAPPAKSPAGRPASSTMPGPGAPRATASISTSSTTASITSTSSTASSTPPIAQGRTSTRLGTGQPLVYVPPSDDSGPVVAKPAPASLALGAPTVRSMPSFDIVPGDPADPETDPAAVDASALLAAPSSTTPPPVKQPDPLLARNATIRGVKPSSMPKLKPATTPPPLPGAGPAKPPERESLSKIPTLDPDSVEIAEPTDLTEIPTPGPNDRKTAIGLGAMGDDIGPVRDTTVMPAEKRPDAMLVPDDSAGASGPSPDAAVDAAVDPTSPLDAEPAGDWTMKPEESEPTPLGGEAEKRESQPSGDWSITPIPDSADGWSMPAKVERPPGPEHIGPPKSEVSSSAPLDSTAKPEPKIGVDEPKVQIDPTLIEPLPDVTKPPPSKAANGANGAAPLPAAPPSVATLDAAMPAPISEAAAASSMAMSATGLPANARTMSAVEVPTGGGEIAPLAAPAYVVPTPPPGAVTYPAQPFPTGVLNPSQHPAGTGSSTAIPGPDQQLQMLGFQQQLVVQETGTSGFFPYATESNPRMTKPRRRGRIAVIAVSAALVVAIGIVVVVMVLGKSSDQAADLVPIEPPSDPAPTPPSDPPTQTPPDQHAITPTEPPRDKVIDAGVTATDDAGAGSNGSSVGVVAEPSGANCVVDVASTPDDAEVVLDKNRVAGRTPMKIELPCGAEARVTLRKAGYFALTRKITPSATATSLRGELDKAVFSIKVSSTPTGATILVNGKSGGVTPANVRVNAYEPTTITMSKDGFTPETEKLTPKNNNQTVHIVLKRKKPR